MTDTCVKKSVVIKKALKIFTAIIELNLKNYKIELYIQD